MYRCEYFDWESLALKLMKTPACRSSRPGLARKLQRVKNRSHEEWRRLALELALVNEHFRIEPPTIKKADRTAARKRFIALRMDSYLTRHPETDRPFSPSVTQAAASVRAELIKMAEADKSKFRDVEIIPTIGSIRDMYYTILRNNRDPETGQLISIRPSEGFQNQIHMMAVIADLIRISEHFEYSEIFARGR
jgi:hypothetical protein